MFCKYCKNRLEYLFIDDELSFSCRACYSYFEPKPEDTLIYERLKNKDTMTYETILSTAADDPANVKKRIDCIRENCDSKIVKQVRVGSDKKLFNICIKCGIQWLN